MVVGVAEGMLAAGMLVKVLITNVGLVLYDERCRVYLFLLEGGMCGLVLFVSTPNG